MWIPRRRLGDSRLFARCRISHSCHALQYPYRHVYLLLSNAHSLSFLLSRRNLSQFPLLLFPHFMHSFLSLFFCHHSSSFSHSSTNSPRHSPFHSLASRAHFLSLHPQPSLSLSHTHFPLLSRAPNQRQHCARGHRRFGRGIKRQAGGLRCAGVIYHETIPYQNRTTIL